MSTPDYKVTEKVTKEYEVEINYWVGNPLLIQEAFSLVPSWSTLEEVRKPDPSKDDTNSWTFTFKVEQNPRVIGVSNDD